MNHHLTRTFLNNGTYNTKQVYISLLKSNLNNFSSHESRDPIRQQKKLHLISQKFQCVEVLYKGIYHFSSLDCTFTTFPKLQHPREWQSGDYWNSGVEGPSYFKISDILAKKFLGVDIRYTFLYKNHLPFGSIF